MWYEFWDKHNEKRYGYTTDSDVVSSAIAQLNAQQDIRIERKGLSPGIDRWGASPLSTEEVDSLDLERNGSAGLVCTDDSRPEDFEIG